MAREVKDASFRAQRASLEWAAGMKERELGYLEKVKEYEVQVKLLSHNLNCTISDKEAAIQELLDAHRLSTQQLEDFYQNKVSYDLAFRQNCAWAVPHEWNMSVTITEMPYTLL
jgi:hypothetical protein